MSSFITITEELHDYLVAMGSREDRALAQVREETAAMGAIAIMQIAPDQGALMRMLARLMGVRRAIEIGTFTGYSGICLARGLAPDGLLVACELSPEHGRLAARNFERAGVSDRIDLRIGPAAETLAELAGAGGEPFDLAFIDADKTGYDGYYEACLELLRPGGLVILDNVLQAGQVLDPQGDESAEAIDRLNAKVRDDERVEIAMIGVADGLTLARKR
jgi:predicted O-methyltransferase YrrM